MVKACDLASEVEERLLERNRIFKDFFAREAHGLAIACREMSERFRQGGRLLAFGRGPYATDAQHVSVEFVHPIIVGKRALPALDLSLLHRPWLDAILRPEDIVMGFGPPEGDAEIAEALAAAGALAWAGGSHKCNGNSAVFASRPAVISPAANHTAGSGRISGARSAMSSVP